MNITTVYLLMSGLNLVVHDNLTLLAAPYETELHRTRPAPQHTRRPAPQQMRCHQMDSTNIGIAGEFYVLAQLAQRGLVASFTLANTKGIDIIVINPPLDHFIKLEVKTTRNSAAY